MLVRIVKLEFHAEHNVAFEKLFETVKNKILASPGCSKVRLMKDLHLDGVYFTYSYWETEKHLNNYRNSSLFLDTWKITKSYFSGKPEAWSLDVISEAKAL